MQLVTYERNNQRSTGALTAAGVVDLPQRLPRSDSPAICCICSRAERAVLAQARESIDAGSPIPPARGPAQSPPLRNRENSSASGLNYADHAAEGGRKKPDLSADFCQDGAGDHRPGRGRFSCRP